AVDLAADEAMARVAPLVVVHALGGSAPGGLLAAHRAVELAVGRARSEHPGLSVTAELLPGDPAEVLVRRAPGGARLVVRVPGRIRTGRRAPAGPGVRRAAGRLGRRAGGGPGPGPRDRAPGPGHLAGRAVAPARARRGRGRPGDGSGGGVRLRRGGAARHVA